MSVCEKGSEKSAAATILTGKPKARQQRLLANHCEEVTIRSGIALHLID